MAWVSFDIPLYKSDVIKSLKSNRVYILILLCLFDLLIAIEFSFQQVQVILYNLACYNKCILSVKRNFKKYVYNTVLTKPFQNIVVCFCVNAFTRICRV